MSTISKIYVQDLYGTDTSQIYTSVADGFHALAVAIQDYENKDYILTNTLKGDSVCLCYMEKPETHDVVLIVIETKEVHTNGTAG